MDSVDSVGYPARVTDDGWPSISDGVAERIKEVRKARGLTTRTLAERCAQLGAPQISASVLMNIESGRRDPDGRRRRDISLDEWAVIAYALGVSPLVLLLPGEDAPYALTPQIATTARVVYDWLIGERMPPLPTGAQPAEATVPDRIAAFNEFFRKLQYIDGGPKMWRAGAYTVAPRLAGFDPRGGVVPAPNDAAIDDMLRSIAAQLAEILDKREGPRQGPREGDADTEDQKDRGR
jgi:transcriptional regulator with XRE-family HTH domain